MPSKSWSGRANAFHEDGGIGCRSEHMARRYIAKPSEYASQRYFRKPLSGIHPWHSVSAPLSIHCQSVRWSNSEAYLRISVSFQYASVCKAPQSSHAVSTEDASLFQMRCPVDESRK